MVDTVFSPDEQARFWERVNKDAPNGCWEWTTYTWSGYGVFVIRNRNFRAHRVSYMLIKGAIPSGLVLDHLCRNRACVNPEHLEAVTNAENIRRGFGPTGINAQKTHCRRGHEFTIENIYYSRKGRECKACRSQDGKARKVRLRLERIMKRNLAMGISEQL